MATPPSKVTIASPATANVAALDSAAPPVVEAAPARRFVTKTEDAPPASALPSSLRGLNAKTIAEQKAGRERLAAYAPVSE